VPTFHYAATGNHQVRASKRSNSRSRVNALRAPSVLGHKDRLIALFENSGVESVGIETHKGTARFASIRTMLEADFRGWLLVMEVQPKKEQIQSILTEAESARAE